jgi:hypothetical protein
MATCKDCGKPSSKLRLGRCMPCHAKAWEQSFGVPYVVHVAGHAAANAQIKQATERKEN